jgi:hypothetical protein
VRLESVVVGGARCTSAEAIARFIRACSGDATPVTPSAVRRRREAETAAALRELSAAGIGT